MDGTTAPLVDGWPKRGVSGFHIASTEAPPREYSFLSVRIERPGHRFDHRVRWPDPGKRSSSISARNLLSPSETTVFTVIRDDGVACTLEVERP